MGSPHTCPCLPVCLYLTMDFGKWEEESHQREALGACRYSPFHPSSFWGPKKPMLWEVQCLLHSAVGSGLPRSGLDSHPISRDSGQSATTFKASATFEELSASEAKLQSCSIFMLLNCHSPDKTQSTLKQFASQNFPSLPHSVQAHRSFEVFL